MRKEDKYLLVMEVQSVTWFAKELRDPKVRRNTIVVHRINRAGCSGYNTSLISRRLWYILIPPCVVWVPP